MDSEQFKYINLVHRLQVEPSGMCGCTEQEAVSSKENNWFPGNPSVPLLFYQRKSYFLCAAHLHFCVHYMQNDQIRTLVVLPRESI